MARSRNIKYKIVKLLTIKEYDSIRDVEDDLHLQSRFYSQVEQYAVYRQDRNGSWVAWLDPVDLARLLNGKMIVEGDDEFDLKDEE